MFHTSITTAKSPGVRLFGGALAFLLLCGAALLGGAQQSKSATTGFWHSGSKAPLVDVTAYPKECQRSGETRWRFSGEGEDPSDQPFALDAFPRPLLHIVKQDQVAQSSHTGLIAFSHHRPQAARAPPVA